MAFLVMTILFLLGVPVAFAMIMASLAFLVTQEHIPLLVIPQRMGYALNSFQLIAVPFFVLAGRLMNTAGVTDRIFSFARTLVGHIVGGLGHVNVVASMIFAGMSGSAVADASGLGQIEIRAMVNEGYDAPFAAAITAASATIGPIIPPSIPLVLYGVVAGVSVGRLLIGGVAPGVLTGLALMLVVYLRARGRNYPRSKRASLADMGVGFLRALPALLTPLILIGGMVGGAFTPTEAAGVAALYSLILGIVYRDFPWKQFFHVLIESAVDFSTILFVVSAASVLGLVVTRQGLPQQLVRIAGAVQSEWVLLLGLCALFLLLGCVMESLSILVVFTPLVVPIARAFGVDMVHLGVVMVFALMIGLITPPVGMTMYISCYLAKISVLEFLREAWLFVVVLVAVLFLITYIPQLVLFLPNLLMGTAA